MFYFWSFGCCLFVILPVIIANYAKSPGIVFDKEIEQMIGNRQAVKYICVCYTTSEPKKCKIGDSLFQNSAQKWTDISLQAKNSVKVYSTLCLLVAK